MPTGSGKTTLASQIIKQARDKNSKVIFLAHRQELIYQAHERLASFGVDAGIIMAGHQQSDKQIQVASVQTLVRRVHPPADIIFVDEVHHCVSSSYRRILNNYKSSLIFGLTATPFRMDRKPLGEIFEKIIVPVTIQDLIDQKFLVQPKYYGAKQDFSDVHITKGDYDTAELFEKMDKQYLYDGVVDKFKQFGHGKTLVFCVNIEHSIKTKDAFVAAGYTAAHLDCDTNTSDRKKILADFASGKYQILTNCAILTEGYNLPGINTIILNRATKSKGLYKQIVGRGLRASDGKTNCIIIDHGNNVYEHGGVELDEEYTLWPPKKKKKSNTSSVEMAKECPECKALLHTRVTVCQYCGHEFPEKELELREAEFEEIKIKKVVIPKHLKKPWRQMSDEELEEYRLLKGYKSGWKYYVKKLGGVKYG